MGGMIGYGYPERRLFPFRIEVLSAQEAVEARQRDDEQRVRCRLSRARFERLGALRPGPAARQAQLEAQHGWTRKRGDHRDTGWYAAIAEACPNYLGVEFPRSSWPTGPRPKKGTNPLTEVEATHWPRSFRDLAAADDPRLPKCT